MKPNMGITDRSIRIVVAIVAAILILTGTIRGWLAIALGIIAAVMLLTGLLGYCPAYRQKPRSAGV